MVTVTKARASGPVIVMLRVRMGTFVSCCIAGCQSILVLNAGAAVAVFVTVRTAGRRACRMHGQLECLTAGRVASCSDLVTLRCLVINSVGGCTCRVTSGSSTTPESFLLISLLSSFGAFASHVLISPGPSFSAQSCRLTLARVSRKS
ncbi:uncharacterized protein B0H18DRAFT_1011472 [Fomitopsis serialis]|uniref:uncharacterized protein n=1 Tax=Fomitopsis serialis TaxID=139415 RepID=UPI00200865A4|nr:uncharacterized protein B0H18DRAFT_1011472 [Neoantrodia serialis]KAH9924505.1 hypothetical protein B0H18DRAFT_1011472 [Neoantrodia serialis]